MAADGYSAGGSCRAWARHRCTERLAPSQPRFRSSVSGTQQQQGWLCHQKQRGSVAEKLRWFLPGVHCAFVLHTTPTGSRLNATTVQQVLDLHNIARAQHGTPPLVWDITAAAWAQRFADNCVWGHDVTGAWREGGTSCLIQLALCTLASVIACQSMQILMLATLQSTILTGLRPSTLGGAICFPLRSTFLQSVCQHSMPNILVPIPRYNDELPLYDWSNPGYRCKWCTPACCRLPSSSPEPYCLQLAPILTHCSDATGHMTALLWKSSTKLGCATQYCVNIQADGSLWNGTYYNW